MNNITDALLKANGADLFDKSYNNFDTSQALKNSAMFGKNKDHLIGTSVPYQTLIPSNLIINPSTVSILEFQKMATTQAPIIAALTIINNLVLNEIGKYEHKNKKYEEFIKFAIDSLDRPLTDIIREMLTALWAGFYVGEKTYTVKRGIYTIIKDIQPRPPTSIMFEVDPHGMLTENGIRQYYFNALWGANANILSANMYFNNMSTPNPYAPRGDLPYPLRIFWAQPIGEVILPLNKSLHFAYKGIDGFTSPYGRSMLRAVYDLYIRRCQLEKIILNAARLRGSTLPVFIVENNDKNTTTGLTPLQSIDAIMKKVGMFDNGAGSNYIALQGQLGKSIWIEKIESTANLSEMVDLLNNNSYEILMALLYPNQISGMSSHGSYGLGETQKDLLGRNITAIVQMISSCLIAQYVKPQLQINFREQDNFGTFVKNYNVSEDIALNLDKINLIKDNGYKLKTPSFCEMIDIRESALESLIPNKVNDDDADNDSNSQNETGQTSNKPNNRRHDKTTNYKTIANFTKHKALS